MPGDDVLKILSCMERDHVHVREMQLHLQHGWGDLAEVKAIDPPQSFQWRNPPRVPELLNLVDVAIAIGLIKRNRCTVMPLVNVLEKVLHGLYARAGLHVDVAIVFPQEVRIVRHNPLLSSIRPRTFARWPSSRLLYTGYESLPCRVVALKGCG